MKKAVIMNVQRYSIHDGPGIRTTVFLKGCHMSCAWCHNPESQNPKPEMLFYQERCIGCGECMKICSRSAHDIVAGKHRAALEICKDCPDQQACSDICPTEALLLCGREVSAEELLQQVLQDRRFYGQDGGVTCSGGEPLLQDAFLEEFLPMCKEKGISTCLDTTLNVPWDRIEKLLPWTDLFLVDIKSVYEDIHREYTGTDSRLLQENLFRLSEAGIPVIIRMPLVAGVNDSPEEAKLRKKLLNQFKNIVRIDCFAVSNHAVTKYRALQREFISFNKGVDEKLLVESVQQIIQENC